jgi:energy-coupling factor transporter ATP-binding protein EcfA2
MHLQEIEIKNIRSVADFRLKFSGNLSGWHVLIGDNGSGKSTIIRSIALALTGPKDAPGLRADWRDWLNSQAIEGTIHLEIWGDGIDQQTGRSAKLKNRTIPDVISFKRNNGSVTFGSNYGNANYGLDPARFNWGEGYGWFSVAYGPYRRFEGGNPEWTKVFYAQPKLGAHLSAFGEDVALTEALDWLVKLNYQVLEGGQSETIIQHLKRLVNSQGFLSHGATIERIGSDGVFFKDGNGIEIHVNELSDGYRSILSLTFELIRQLIRVYGEGPVFSAFSETSIDSELKISLPGVVLIDEIDAHLHPTWQTRIGNWFTNYFPNIQFIVTTHSPLICRACENGSIWRLYPPGSDKNAEEVIGIEREKLIYGNILDAYGTEIFGASAVRSDKSNEKLHRLGRLNMLSAIGKISPEEESERIYLQQTLSSDAPTGQEEPA